MPYTDIYISERQHGYEIWLINLDIPDLDPHIRLNPTFIHLNDKIDKKAIGIIPYSIVHNESYRWYKDALKELKQYDCVREDYSLNNELRSGYIWNKYFSAHYSTIGKL